MNAPRVAVIGAGLMGHGIAQVFADAGSIVRVQDPSAEMRETLRPRVAAGLRLLDRDEAAAARVTACAGIGECVGDAELVIEAAPEDLDTKRRIFAEIEAHATESAILASNTSVIPITQIMRDVRLPARALGTHWWNPPTLVPLVEVIATERTSEDAVAATLAWLGHAGKTAVRVMRDIPGFVGNRLQHALWREAVALVADGVCDAETVDTVVKASFGRRLSVLGPLENADLVGTDLTLAIHRMVLPDLDRTAGASPYLERLVAERLLGMKSGQGFRRWTPEEQAALRARVAKTLRRCLEDDRL